MNKENLLEELKRALFEDWKTTKLKEDGNYDEKLYTVTSDEFIKRCKEKKLCQYTEMGDGTFKAAIATLNYDEQPQYETEKKEDVVLLELCLKRLEKETIAKKLHEVYCEERKQKYSSFDELSQQDKNYYYNEITICLDIIQRAQDNN